MKRFYLYQLYSLHRKHFSRDFSVNFNKDTKTKLQYVSEIKKVTGCPTDKVVKALSSKLELQMLPKKDVILKLRLLKKMELYDLKSLNFLPLLKKHPISLKNKYAALCEYGFPPYLICAFHLKRFSTICKYSVKELKEKGYIEKNKDVMKVLWEHAGLDVSKCPQVTEEENLRSLKALVLKIYFKEKLHVSEEEFEKQSSEIKKRLLNKSLKNINTNLKIFQDFIKLSNKRIFTNWFVLFMDSDNTMEILRKVPFIGSTDIKFCLHVYPKIASMPVENMEKMINYLKAAGISITALERFPIILTLNCDTVKDRLKELKNNDFFSVYYNHPSIVQLLHFQVKAKQRLNILQDLKIICTMSYLISSEKDFERTCEFGRRASGVDSVYYLMAELDLSKDEILNKLKRHKRWQYVPVVDIAKNLNYLRKTFSDEEILHNICVLFYYHGRLLQEMEKLEQQELIEIFKENGKIKKEFILPLTIYFLEKETNFTGESIWEACVTNPYEDLPDASEIKVNSV